MTAFTLLAGHPGTPNIRANMLRWLRDSLPAEKSWRISVAPFANTRTNLQNRYLWAANKAIGDAIGFGADDVHVYLLGSKYGWRERELPGGRFEQIPVRTTTTDENGKRAVMSRAVFADYADYVLRYAANLGVFVDAWVEL